MLNIQDYQRYSGEKKIALMDNSTVSFLEQVERAGISTKELLKDYDAILIPNWVSEEICDSIYRKDYIERLYAAGLPIYSIAEESYADLVNGEEANLFKIVSAAASKLGQLRGYLQQYVKKNGMLSLGQIDTLRCDERVVVYTRSRDDKSTALVAKRTDNQQFKALLQDMNVQIIF